MLKTWRGFIGVLLTFAVSGYLLILLLPEQSKVGFVLINSSVFGFLWIIAICLHELGHAIIARILRLEIARIELGFGRSIANWQILGFDIRLLEEFDAGAIIYERPHGHRASLKTVLVIFAGPAVNICLALVAIYFQIHFSLLKFISSFFTEVAFLQMFAIANFYRAAVDLWPFFKEQNDGKEIVRILSSREDLSQ